MLVRSWQGCRCVRERYLSCTECESQETSSIEVPRGIKTRSCPGGPSDPKDPHPGANQRVSLNICLVSCLAGDSPNTSETRMCGHLPRPVAGQQQPLYSYPPTSL